MKMLKLKSALRVGHGILTLFLLPLLSFPSFAQTSEPLKVLVVTGEHAAFHGSGGLGSMIKAFSQSLQDGLDQAHAGGADVTVAMPFFMRFYQKPGLVESLHDEGREITVGLDYGYGEYAHRQEKFRIYSGRYNNVKMLFFRHENRWGEPNYFDNKLDDNGKGDLYAPADREWEAFGAFSKALATYTYEAAAHTRLVVLNDWHTGAYAYFAKHPSYIGFAGRKPPKILSLVHNYAHQGKAGHHMMGVLGMDTRDFTQEGVEHYGDLNNLKILKNYSDMSMTVSRNHAEEVLGSRFGRTFEGMNRLLNSAYEFTGILNGIDSASWQSILAGVELMHLLADIEHVDPELYHFHEDDLSGMARGKAIVQKYFDLKEDPEAMILTSVARLDPQKGFDFLNGVFYQLLERHPHVQIVIVGDPSPTNERFQHQMEALARDPRYRGRFAYRRFSEIDERVSLAFDDLVMNFSVFEPSGLVTQQANGFGTLSIATRVGGHVESVRAEGADRTGFLVDVVLDAHGRVDTEKTAASVLRGLDEACRLFVNHRAEWNRMVVNALRTDHSWKNQVKEYIKLIDYVLRDGPAKLVKAYGAGSHDKVLTPSELWDRLNAVDEDCGGILHDQTAAKAIGG